MSRVPESAKQLCSRSVTGPQCKSLQRLHKAQEMPQTPAREGTDRMFLPRQLKDALRQHVTVR